MQHKQPQESQTTPPSRYWRRKYKCKKNKGPHTWVIHSLDNTLDYKVATILGEAYGTWRPSRGTPPVPVHTMSARSWVYWRCSACNKKDYEILSEDANNSMFGYMQPQKKLFDPFRHHENNHD